ncbi:MAG: transcription termination/antitermination protein NusA [Candidatus Omnitrophica bacterium]|nr:transcription termination/antitermination protein NusA [Candidatus Omnitrophota bacterium]
MSNSELLNILDSIERERGIDKNLLLNMVESALLSAAKKAFAGKTEDVSVKIDKESGEIKVISEGKEVVSNEFGRIAAQTAKQVIIQKLREAERDVIFEEYQAKVGQIISGVIHRVEPKGFIIDLGKIEALLYRKEVPPRENYRQGERIRAFLVDVKKGNRGPQILLSRTHAGLVKRLFETEVPEINEGLVEIKSVSREAGDRSKIAVYSRDKKIDCVGACVGVRGTRVKNIVKELHGERIDIVRWEEDPREFIIGALSPAVVAELKLDTKERKASVLVEDDQLSLAIGKRGQNVRLAVRLTGWNIDIRGRSEMAAKAVPLTEIPGVGEKLSKILLEAGFDSVAALAKSNIEALTGIKGIGKKTAEKVLSSARELLSKRESVNTEKANDKAADVAGNEPAQDITKEEKTE